MEAAKKAKGRSGRGAEIRVLVWSATRELLGRLWGRAATQRPPTTTIAAAITKKARVFDGPQRWTIAGQAMAPRLQLTLKRARARARCGVAVPAKTFPAVRPEEIPKPVAKSAM